MTKALIIVFLCVISGLIYAQPNRSKLDDGSDGQFSIPYFETCQGNIPITAPAGCNVDGQCVLKILPDGEFVDVKNGIQVPITKIGSIKIYFKNSDDPDEFIDLIVYPDELPDFEVYSCNGNQIAVDILNQTFPQFTVTYPNGSVDGPKGMQPPRLLTPGPDQPISVAGKYNDCPANTKTVDVVATTPARDITKLEVMDDNSIVLDLEQGAAFEDVRYSLLNNGVEVEQFKGDLPRSVASLSPDNQVYGFTLATANPCPDGPLSGNTIYSSSFTVTPQLDNQMFLQWQTTSPAELINFTILKNDALLSNPLKNERQFPDPGVNCPTSYKYQLVSNYQNGYTSLSKARNVAAISSIRPTAIDEISSIVDQGSVQLKWAQDPLFTPMQYTITKIPGGVIGTSTTQQFTDENYDMLQNPCYRISYLDGCGNQSLPAAGEACPIELKGKLNDSNSAELNWTLYAGWKDNTGVDHYTIERYSESGTLISTEDKSFLEDDLTDPENEAPDQVVLYKVIAHPVNTALTPSESNLVRIIRSNRIYYPTAFVPGSSIEDNATFKAIAREEYNAEYDLQVYNRWGELMFHTTDINEGWDGTYKGNKMPEGTYVFISRFVDSAGRTLKHSGNVVLLRK